MAIRSVSLVSEMSIERSFRWHVLFNTNLFSPSLGTMFFYLFSLCVKKHANNKCRHICSMANIIILIASIETQNCQQKETMSSALSQTILNLLFQHYLKIIPFINYIWYKYSCQALESSHVVFHKYLLSTEEWMWW